ncbi:hypothetical protein EZI54_18575 [Marinobacter halodurans]|uniref:Uncharacterized protein n=1 Tax=Marinobacter halodurans TaxID=2528979 RepID=A0ABY1ZFU1_9GAMM|nr:hypothetical protein [Marinobacter halodurans]TBW50155.1 hypothetical protein EZI54_18575 [Marinobacter halodurans]
MAIFDIHRVFRAPILACWITAIGTGVPVWADAAPRKASSTSEAPVALTVEGISVQADDDYPRVLNILPWQPPSISRRNREPLRLAPDGLLDPVDPYALKRHGAFRRTLDPLGEPLGAGH